MEFVDYYAALNLKRDADAKQIRQAFLAKLDAAPQPEQFQLCTEAYSVLRNRYKRARYDRSLGHLLVIQAYQEDYPSASVFQLNSFKPAFGFKNLIEYFQSWVMKKYNITWEEAQLAQFAYQLGSGKTNPFVILRFPQEQDMKKFIADSLQAKIIKRFGD
jgi:curved DNA-binding protein CbpA